MSRPLILIDALAYDPRDGGFATAIDDLLASCLEIEEFRFVVAHHASHDAAFRAFGLPRASLVFPYKLRFLASLLMLPWVARGVRADAVHCEISALPRGVGVPGSMAVHDLFFLQHPEAGGSGPGRWLLTNLYWRRLFVGSLRRARVLKAISETTAADVHRVVGRELPLRVVAPRVEVPIAEECAWPRACNPAAFERREPLHLLYLGSVVPRKNLPFLLDALALVRRDWRLDVAGNAWWGMEEVGRADPRVSFHGYVSDARREQLIADCDVLVAPSRYEGFGYPVAEAMARDRLVLTSDIGAFREFVPDGCRFGLDDPAELASRIDGLDGESYERLLPACGASVRRFTPEANVAGHRAFFRELVGR